MSISIDTIAERLRLAAEVHEAMAQKGAESIAAAATLIAAAFRRGGKLLLCGNGGSAADCQHMAAEFMGRLTRERDRPAMPAIALTTDTSFITAYSNDAGFEGVFARQVSALGAAGDVLMAISTSGSSPNVVAAAKEARRKALKIVALVGQDGLLADAADVAIRVPTADTQLAQQVHLAVEHLICHLVERDLVHMTLTIALAQANPTVGDVAGNAAIVRRLRDEAASAGADLVVFSELILVGYPPEDLVLHSALVDAAARALRELERDSTPTTPALVVPLPWNQDGQLHNAVAFVADGQTQIRFKHELPNYGVFDEKRVFEPGPLPEPIAFRGMRIGLPICEDIWLDHVTTHLTARGAQMFLVPNGSPFEVEKFAHRLELARARTAESGVPLAYVNQVGGQDELVFDGGSFVMNPDGSLGCLLPFWREAVTLTRWTEEAGRFTCPGSVRWSEPPRLDAVYSAMVLGLRDYVRKNRFPAVVLGMSGGIDSALTAAVAVDALGAASVRGVRLPSRFTSQPSLDDATESASLLGMRLETLPIESTVAAAEATLAPVFDGRPRDVSEENLQARIRGLLLMGLSNKFGELLVTTGNKSEMSVGYATLYGDMCGGYSVLKDIYKTEVYALARWRNTHLPEGACGPRGQVIPESSLTKAPTAELRPNQTDQDSLPPYEELDAILHGLVEEELSVPQIVARGFPRETVSRVQRLLYSAEYKRRQAPPGVKITRKSFGRDRRYPLTNGFREP